MGLIESSLEQDVNVVTFCKPYPAGRVVTKIKFLIKLHSGNTDFEITSNGFRGREGVYGSDSELLKVVLTALFGKNTGVKSVFVTEYYLEVNNTMVLSQEDLEKLVLQACQKYNPSFRKVYIY